MYNDGEGQVKKKTEWRPKIEDATVFRDRKGAS